MQFAEDFFKGEYRNGFYIRPMMKRVWAAQLEVLEEIEKICQRHAISWFVDFGTLLGAVRERGYIAWDDDLDLGMHRNDFERFRYYAKQEMPEKYCCINGRTEDSRDLVFSVHNESGISWGKEHMEKYHGCPYAVCVDIFPYDNIPDDDNELKTYKELFSLAFVAGETAAKDALLCDSSSEIQTYVRAIQDLVHIEVDDKKPIKEQLLHLADYIAAMYHNENTEKVAISYFWAEKSKYAIPASYISSLAYLPFEGRVVPVPVGYKDMLEVYYGKDYMIPKQEYDTHNYPYFKGQEETLFKWFHDQGLEVPECFRE